MHFQPRQCFFEYVLPQVLFFFFSFFQSAMSTLPAMKRTVFLQCRRRSDDFFPLMGATKEPFFFFFLSPFFFRGTLEPRRGDMFASSLKPSSSSMFFFSVMQKIYAHSLPPLFFLAGALLRLRGESDSLRRDGRPRLLPPTRSPRGAPFFPPSFGIQADAALPGRVRNSSSGISFLLTRFKSFERSSKAPSSPIYRAAYFLFQLLRMLSSPPF